MASTNPHPQLSPIESAPTPIAPAAPRQIAEEPDARNSLRHILADDPAPSEHQQFTPSTPRPTPVTQYQQPLQPRLAAATPVQVNMASVSTPGSAAGDVAPSTAASASGTKPIYTATTTTTRRNANGSVSSVYSGNKIRHLKKEDGVPLWRRDIQYDFLKNVFEDEQKVFHKVSDKSYGHTFADIYLDAMAKSSKCSKILKDKLLTERPAALNMAMVCLLVNVGRMNTTLNFFPEMRAQLRTYHSIPSLQARQDPNAYKQLQDAPRLKSILKGATEDTEQPSTLEDIRSAQIPRTNPVNLIFVLSQYAPKISEMHFDVPRDFFDLVMKPTLSSKSRATSFLWLMWWYLESDFSTKDALANPYGPGRRSRDADEREMPIKCPQFEYLSEEQALEENVDTDEEYDFGELKRKERVAILATDMAPVVTGPKRTSKKAAYNSGVGVFSVASDNDTGSPGQDYNSPAPSTIMKSMNPGSIKDEQYDSDQTRSASPTGSYAVVPPPLPKPTPAGMRINTLLNDDAPTPPASIATVAKGPGRGNWGHRRKTNRDQDPGSAAPRSSARQVAEEEGPGIGSRPHGYYIPLNGQLVEPKRTRPLTSHQQAVERYRNERVTYILDRGLRDAQAKAKRKRGKESAISRAWKRCKALPDGWDSDEEGPASTGGPDGNGVMVSRETQAARALVMMASLKPCHWERPDWGEEAMDLASGLRRVTRRTERWESGGTVVRRKDLPKEEREEMYEDGEGMEYEDGDGEGGDERGERSSLPGGDEGDEMDYDDEEE